MPKRNIVVRNTVALSPLLRKGGPHVKSRTGQRVRSRLSTNSAIDEWLEDVEEDTSTRSNNKGSESSPFISISAENLIENSRIFRRIPGLPASLIREHGSQQPYTNESVQIQPLQQLSSWAESLGRWFPNRALCGFFKPVTGLMNYFFTYEISKTNNIST